MDKVRVWLIGGSNEVHPDDLARAIRREMAAEIEIIRDDLRKGIDVDDALRWSHDRLTAPAPREPAQERQDGSPATRTDEDFRSGDPGDVELVHTAVARHAAWVAAGKPANWHGGVPESATPAGGADPLLPGLRYVRQNMPLLGNSVGKVAQCAEQWLDAEIARREGGWQPWQPTHRHYKGGLYRVLMEGTYEASGGRCVIYQGQDGRVWVRMQDAFIENVVHEGVTQPRFAEIAQREGA